METENKSNKYIEISRNINKNDNNIVEAIKPILNENNDGIPQADRKAVEKIRNEIEELKGQKRNDEIIKVSEISELKNVPENFFIDNQAVRKAIEVLAAKFPEMHDLRIAYIDPDNKVNYLSKGPHFVKHPADPTKGTIFLPDFSEKYFEEDKAENIEITKKIAKGLGIKKEQVNSNLLALFALLHEFDHAQMAKDTPIDEWRSKTPTKVGPFGLIKQKNKRKMQKKYRRNELEKRGDDFAINFMRENLEDIFG